MSFNRDQLAKDIAPICDTHTEHCLRCEILLGIIERVWYDGARRGMDALATESGRIARERVKAHLEEGRL